jgi:hypothetical protein
MVVAEAAQCLLDLTTVVMVAVMLVTVAVEAAMVPLMARGLLAAVEQAVILETVVMVMVGHHLLAKEAAEAAAVAAPVHTEQVPEVVSD